MIIGIEKCFKVLMVITVLNVVVMCQGNSSTCEQGSKLTQYTGTICQIDYEECSNNDTLTIQMCIGYRCRLQVQGQCYYYSYQSFTNSRCMRDCCGYYSLNNTQDYSTQLAQCLKLNSYENYQNDSITPPSNKMAIILGCLLGVVFFIIVTTCICCRQKIKNMLAGNNNQIPRSNQNIHPMRSAHHISYAQIYSTDINFVLDNSSNELHYDKEQQCTICLSQSNNARTHCSHWYHLECLMAWVKKSFHCPNCMTQEMNPITVFCKKCRKPYAEVKINKYTEARHLQNSLNSFKCNQCKNQN